MYKEREKVILPKINEVTTNTSTGVNLASPNFTLLHERINFKKTNNLKTLVSDDPKKRLKRYKDKTDIKPLEKKRKSYSNGGSLLISNRAISRGVNMIGMIYRHSFANTHL